VVTQVAYVCSSWFTNCLKGKRMNERCFIYSPWTQVAEHKSFHMNPENAMSKITSLASSICPRACVVATSIMAEKPGTSTIPPRWHKTRSSVNFSQSDYAQLSFYQWCHDN